PRSVLGVHFRLAAQSEQFAYSPFPSRDPSFTDALLAASRSAHPESPVAMFIPNLCPYHSKVVSHSVLRFCRNCKWSQSLGSQKRLPRSNAATKSQKPARGNS